MGSILKRLEFIADLLPDNQIAIENTLEALTYRELFERIQRCSRWLTTQNRHCIGLYAGNGIDWIVADLACQEAGLVCVPIPTFFSKAQISACISESGINCVLTDRNSLKSDLFELGMFASPVGKAAGTSLHAFDLPSLKTGNYPKNTQKITFTSGSTGHPKGVCLSKEHQWNVAQSLADRVNIPHARHLCLLPLSTLLENIAGVYSPLLSGGTIRVPDDPSRGFSGSSGIDMKTMLGCISASKPDTLILIPQLLSALVQATQQGWMPPENLKFIAVGGGKVSSDLIIRARQLGLPVYQGYGLSECGSVVALNTPQDDQSDSVGKTLQHCQVEIVDSEILVSGSVFLGYLGEPDTWYPETVHTGDLGTKMNQFIYVDGRKKNLMISTFGRNISPEWVESELLSGTFINQCVVFGDDQPYLTALLSAYEQVTENTIEQWIDVVNQRLPDYARIRQWKRLGNEDFASCMTENGRLKRQQLEQIFSREIALLYQNSPQNSHLGMVLP